MAKKADPLAQYNAKRDFTATAEPAGKEEQGKGDRFIVQKHDATRLHWDFRIEVDGVLKSWAVTKGPSADPADKRLAVRTEDHPMAYAEFEGAIPKGEYGGGTVMLWDRGTWAPIPGKSAKDIDEGHLHFTLQGERMNGEWLLVRMKPRGNEKRENWLLRKIDDEHAGGSDDLIGRHLPSVLTGRSMAEIAADQGGDQSLKGVKGAAFDGKMQAAAEHNSKVAKKRKTGGKPPEFRPLQFATLVDAVPTGNEWLHEIKYDGYRALISVAGGKVRVFTRSGLDWTSKFAPLAAEIAALDLPSALIDGEIVATDKHGNPDFSSLQAVLKRGHGEQGSTRLQFFAFDLLEQDGEKLDKLGNLERKERLEALLKDAAGAVAVSDHVIGAGEKLYRAMCDAGQEGIISKRADAAYLGKRTQNWVKVKCTRRQEFVIVGWKESSAKARPFASLLLAQFEDGELAYKGNVGTGFDDDTLAMLAKKFARLERKTAPVEVHKVAARKVHWLTPELVAEIGFAEFTAGGSVRHASFIGLRGDKPASEVTPEVRKAAPKPAQSAVRISSRERVIFPEAKATKGDLADYYVAVAPILLPHLARRPLSLVRCPQGRAKKCFFQKHDSGSFGEEVHHVPITEKDGGTEDYLYVDSADGVLACVQMGTIELHGWGCHVDDVERPDRMVFDLDPDEGLDFGDVKKAAADLKEHLADIGLVSFAMLSGGKGVHVVVPLDAGHSWDAHKDFSKRFAEALSLAEPDRFVATMSKAKRKGKIFIDYLRNQRGSTAILPYAARARENAPVAVPIGWDALADVESAHRWTIRDATELLDRAASAELKGWGFASQTLPEL
ncbi:DNA ligase D [Altererythrobacter sp. KTW20L]|uniref:DNA ligase D n=1 Tax=Altererythrobacter sp. KTW20L TaxID=2942210 RepID=UPI0020BF994A|nr:DNA ligase D [Altererythrobacter sp. KTW20L]MCL6250808.1 DNA ligase D [Altererythrobacter sp. KTW20L]